VGTELFHKDGQIYRHDEANGTYGPDEKPRCAWEDNIKIDLEEIG
jgi:hypothetical protein